MSRFSFIDFDWIVERLFGKAVQHGSNYENKIKTISKSNLSGNQIIAFKQRLEDFEKSANHTQSQIKKEINLARTLRNTDRTLAIQHLKKAKTLEDRLKTQQSVISQMQKQILAMEDNDFNNEAIITMNDMRQYSKSQQSDITKEDIHELQTDIQELINTSETISNELSLSINQATDDKYELDALETFDQWEKEDKLQNQNQNQPQNINSIDENEKDLQILQNLMSDSNSYNSLPPIGITNSKKSQNIEALLS